MKFITALVVLASCGILAAANVHATTGLYWDDAFPPGSAQLPQIALDISCVDASLCFIAGGSNGVGFGVYSYDGRLNGNVEQMNMLNASMMIVSLEAGGTAQNPHAASGGVGTFFTSGFIPEHYYNPSNKTWMPSAFPMEFATATPSLSATTDGNHVIALDGGEPSGLLVSHDAAHSYTLQPINGFPGPNYGNCSAANIVEIVNATTWYIVLGQEPQTASSSSSASSASSSFSASGRRTYRKKNMQYTLDLSSGSPRVSATRVPKADPTVGLGSGETCVGYSYQIIKTTDGGNTYTAILEQANASFTFYDIACLDANRCVLVGGNDMSSVVYMTKDGQNWNLVYTVNANTNASVAFSEVAYVNASDIWIGGEYADEVTQTPTGVFYYSRDGGRTWFEYSNLQYAVATIVSLSFPSPTVGFATGVTQEQSSSVLKYAPQPYHGYFAQKQCLNNACDLLCQEMYFPQGMCIEGSGGGIIATCTATGLTIKSYETTSCIGSFNTSTAPINQCLQASGSGGLPYFENLCNVNMIRKEEEPQTHRAGAKVFVKY